MRRAKLGSTGRNRAPRGLLLAPSPSNATALDGFANLSPTGASVLFGGNNDGTIRW